MKNHSERAHSKFSASGAERWFNCPGSVELSEGQPDKSSPWAQEGTLAHEVLESVLKRIETSQVLDREMVSTAHQAADFIFRLAAKSQSELLVESKVHLDFIHPEAFGTLDSAVPEYFGTLHVLDFKYGKGYVVSPKENLQMLFYALAMAHKLDWNFVKARLWIIQPRSKGYDGPVFWDVSICELRTEWLGRFRLAVDNVLKNPTKYVEGQWCHWCKAKAICPLKLENKNEKARMIFGSVKGESNAKEEKEKSKKESEGEETRFDGWTYKKGNPNSRC